MTLTRKLERMREKYKMEQATSNALREALEDVTLRGILGMFGILPSYLVIDSIIESKTSVTIEQMKQDYRNLEKMMENCQNSKAAIESTLKSLRQELNAAIDRIKLEGNFGTDFSGASVSCETNCHLYTFACSSRFTCT